MADTTVMTRRSIFWLLAAAAILWFANLDYRHLAQPDEGRYAEICLTHTSGPDCAKN